MSFKFYSGCFKSIFFKKAVQVFVIVTPLILYIATLSKTIYGGDAGDFASAVLTKSFAHPPGYPFYTMLGLIFDKLPFYSFIEKIALISALATTVSAYLLFKIILILSEDFKFLSEAKKRLFAYFAILFFVFNYIVWLYSVTIEVFALNTTIVLALFYFTLLYIKLRQSKYLYIIYFLIGLGFAHHHTFILVLPSIIILLAYELRIHFSLSWRFLLLSFFCFLLGLSPYLYVVWASFNNSVFNWGKVTNLSSFLELFFRKAYGTFLAGPFILNILDHRLLQLKNLIIYMISDFTYVGFVLIIIGFIFAFSLKSRYFYALILAFILTGPFFVFYANFPLLDVFMFAVSERFLFLFYAISTIFLYLGIVLVYKFISKIRFSSNFSKIFIVFFYNLILIVLALFLLFRNYSTLKYLRIELMPEKMIADVLDYIDNNSIVLLNNDTLSFSGSYYFFANEEKYFNQENKIVLSSFRLPFRYYLDNIKSRYKKIVLPEDIDLTKFLLENKKNFNIYSNSRYTLNSDDYDWVNIGLLYKLVKKDEKLDQVRLTKRFWNNSYVNEILRLINSDERIFKNLYLYDIRRIYAVGLQNSSYTMMLAKDYKTAEEYLNKAEILYPFDADIYYLYAELFYQKNNCEGSYKKIKLALDKKPNDETYLNFLLKLSDNCFPKGSGKYNEIKDYLDNALKTPL
ncbi:MAG: hypothetical protein KatS3mg090_0920 [Patescibacteria group bacterium]|nr:MAG: hypothetical protein KatS3mg090_0920 [Patescibacteria group bacterium]